MSLRYVNFRGDTVLIASLGGPAKKAAPKKKAAEYHKGWAVLGVDPERVIKAQEEHEYHALRQQRERAFDADKWIKDAPLKPARTKPFEVESSAYQCAELARKAGWHRVTVRCLSSAA
jgi:hypothetical protein